MSVTLSIFMFLRRSSCLCISETVCLYLSACFHVCDFVSLSLLSVSLRLSVFVCLLVCLPVCLSACLLATGVFLLLCLSACLLATGMSVPLCLSACLSSCYRCVSPCLSACLLATGMSVPLCLSACLSFCYRCVSPCLSACLSFCCWCVSHLFLSQPVCLRNYPSGRVAVRHSTVN